MLTTAFLLAFFLLGFMAGGMTMGWLLTYGMERDE